MGRWVCYLASYLAIAQFVCSNLLRGIWRCTRRESDRIMSAAGHQWAQLVHPAGLVPRTELQDKTKKSTARGGIFNGLF